jgi:hypothetical protein
VLKALDSLVDIVSNNLGILIILAAFMALFGLIDPASLQEPEQAQARLALPKKLLVPWSHPTHKHPILFVMKGNRILQLDMPGFFKALAEEPRQTRPKAVTIRQEEVTVRFFPVTNQVYCLEFQPKPRTGETWHQAGRPTSRWSRALAGYRPEKFYYFFWVSGDSFELFREVRKRLWDAQYEVGWKPIEKQSPLEICNGFEGATGFQPQ